MPSQKPRVGWIIEPELIAQVKALATEHGRTISKEVEQALKAWIAQHQESDAP